MCVCTAVAIALSSYTNYIIYVFCQRIIRVVECYVYSVHTIIVSASVLLRRSKWNANKKTLRYSPRILCRVVTLQLKHCKNIYNRGIFLYKRTRKRVRNRRDNIDYDLQRRLIIHKPRTTSVVSHVRHWESRYVRERQT